MNISDRLKLIIKDKRLTITEFSNICKIPYPSLQNYLMGKRSIRADSLLKMNIHMDVNINWLLSGEGDMYIQAFSSKEKLLCLGEKWLREYWEQADEKERAWLEVQMKKCFPEFKEWLEQQKS